MITGERILKCVLLADRHHGLTEGVRRLLETTFDAVVMVALNPPRTEYVPLKQAVAKLKLVPLNGHGVLTARTLDISFGD